MRLLNSFHELLTKHVRILLKTEPASCHVQFLRTTTTTMTAKTTNIAALVRASSTWHDEKESSAAHDLNPPKAGRRCALMSRATIMETTVWLSTHNGPTPPRPIGPL